MKVAGKKNQKRLEKLNKLEAQEKERLKQIEEESRSIKRVFEAEEVVMKTLMQLNSQLVKLNELNAIHNRGAVDIEDLCYHHLYSQEKFNEEYKKGRQRVREKFLKEHPEFKSQNEQSNDEKEEE